MGLIISGQRIWEWEGMSYAVFPVWSTLSLRPIMIYSPDLQYASVSKSFRTGRLERELQVVQLSATRCRCIAILWVSETSVYCCKRIFRYRLSPETFGYTLVKNIESAVGAHCDVTFFTVELAAKRMCSCRVCVFQLQFVFHGNGF